MLDKHSPELIKPNPSRVEGGDLTFLDSNLVELRNRQAEEFLAQESAEEKAPRMTKDDIYNIETAVDYWLTIRPWNTRPCTEDLEEVGDDFISYSQLLRMENGGLKGMRAIIDRRMREKRRQEEGPGPLEAKVALHTEPETHEPETTPVEAQEEPTIHARNFRYSPKPILMPEDVDVWADFDTSSWAELDRLWLIVSESIAEASGDPNILIEPNLENLNKAAIDHGGMPPGDINAKFKHLGGLEAFQLRHGYREAGSR